MKRVKAWGIIVLGSLGILITPSDSLMQALTGVTMFAVAVWLGRRNWRSVYRETIKFTNWIDRNIFRYSEEDMKRERNECND